ncbi:hypothetical protein WG909_06475 [Peptostreptococcaceae bacterium AGR-M142]
MKIEYLKGNIVFESSLDIEELAELLSVKIFGNAKFGGLENNIYDENQVVVINDFMGLCVALFGAKSEYCLDIGPENFKGTFRGFDKKDVDLSRYLRELMKSEFRGCNKISKIRVP